MQALLAVDLSTDIGHAVVVTIDGKSVRVLENHSLPLNGLFSRPNLRSIGGTPTLESNEIDDDTTGPGPTSLDGANVDYGMKGSDQEAPVENPSATTPDTTPDTTPNTHNDPITELLAKVKTPWSGSILVVPAHDYISLNIELPFSDSRSINKIIDLEVQDVVPFEVSEFILNHRAIAPFDQHATNENTTSNEYDVHVGLMPKKYMKFIMEKCRTAGFEPLVVSPPSSVLGALYYLAPQYFSEDSAIIFEQLPYFYILTALNGQIRSDRTISHPYFESLNGDRSKLQKDDGNRSLLTDLRLSLAYTERRYGKSFERVYYIGKSFLTGQLQEALGRHVEEVFLSEFVKSDNDQVLLPALGGVFIQDVAPALSLSNFRVREFSYSPQLKELLRGIKVLGPYILMSLGALLIYLLGSYLVTAYQINRMQNTIRSEIMNVVSDLQAEPGQELNVIQSKNQALEGQLNDISSLTTLTPFDLLAEISKDLPETLGIAISSIKIKDNKLILEGSAKSYQDRDSLAKIFDSRKSFYHRVKLGSGGGIAAQQGWKSFSFEIWTEE